MKNSINGAVGYVRISVRDQSVYSIPFQKKAIAEYCANNHLDLLALFTDDGESSYTFDRPNWLLLELFLREHKGKVKYLIVLDHDRFSRNIAEALKKMEQLEAKAGIKVLSVYEPVNTDTGTSEVFLSRAFKLLLANNELLKIRERTRNGIRLALESGRVVNSAPFGYKNARDDNGRPIIIEDVERAAIVRQIFLDFMTGLLPKKIISDARQRGFTLKGRDALTRVLTNPLYAGLVRVPAYGGKPAKLVHGIHAPIVSEAVYRKAAELLGHKPKQKSIPREAIFLRGMIHCPCGAPFTGGFSKGKCKYYLYYRCIHHTSPNYRGEVVHALFHETLKKLYLKESIKDCIVKMVNEKINECCRSEEFIIENDKRELAQVERKLDKLEECLLNSEISPTVYKKWEQKLQEQKTVLLKEINSLNHRNSDLHQHFLELFPDLSNLNNIFLSFSFVTGQQLIKKVFETGLTYDGQIFSTSYLHPALSYLNESCNKNISLGKMQQIEEDVQIVTHNKTTIEDEKHVITEDEFADTIARFIIDTITIIPA